MQRVSRHSARSSVDLTDLSRFGFVQFYNFESCENCIRGFFYLGYQASFAQVSSLASVDLCLADSV